METPSELKYSKDHEWVRVEDDGKLRIGITDFAQDALGDIVYVALPTVEAVVSAGDSVSEVESTKSISDIYAPAAGKIVSVNTDLVDTPEALNTDPYGDGWIMLIEPDASFVADNLLDAQAYVALMEV